MGFTFDKLQSFTLWPALYYRGKWTEHLCSHHEIGIAWLRWTVTVRLHIYDPFDPRN